MTRPPHFIHPLNAPRWMTLLLPPDARHSPATSLPIQYQALLLPASPSSIRLCCYQPLHLPGSVCYQTHQSNKHPKRSIDGSAFALRKSQQWFYHILVQKINTKNLKDKTRKMCLKKWFSCLVGNICMELKPTAGKQLKWFPMCSGTTNLDCLNSLALFIVPFIIIEGQCAVTQAFVYPPAQSNQLDQTSPDWISMYFNLLNIKHYFLHFKSEAEQIGRASCRERV